MQANTGVGTDRVTRVIHRTYAVTRLEADIASGRVEDPMLVHKKIHVVNFFVNKKKVSHAAAGESGVHRIKRPDCISTAYVLSYQVYASLLPLSVIR